MDESVGIPAATTNKVTPKRNIATPKESTSTTLPPVDITKDVTVPTINPVTGETDPIKLRDEAEHSAQFNKSVQDSIDGMHETFKQVLSAIHKSNTIQGKIVQNTN